MMNTPPLPESVVQRQLDAYNARDLEALLGIYAPDAELFEHPGTPLARGTAELRVRFAARFTEPGLHAQLLNRIVMGQIVIDHEIVTRCFPEGPGTLALVMIYEVRGDRIAKAWNLPGPKHLTGASMPGRQTPPPP